MSQDKKPEKEDVVEKKAALKAKAAKKADDKKPAKKAKSASSAKSAAKKKDSEDKAPAEPKAYAVIRSGGKQYRVSPGDKVLIDSSEEIKGESVSFTDVLATGVVGKETKILAGKTKSLGVTVTGRVLGPVKEKKVIIFKKRRRGGYTKKQGHRQEKIQVLVESIA